MPPNDNNARSGVNPFSDLVVPEAPAPKKGKPKVKDSRSIGETAAGDPIFNVAPIIQNPSGPPKRGHKPIYDPRIVRDSVPESVTAPPAEPEVLPPPVQVPPTDPAPEPETEPGPPPQDDGPSAYLAPTRTKLSLSLCLPIRHELHYLAAFALFALIKRYECGIHIQAETLVTRARNILANLFLGSPSEWSLWVDADVVVPWGNAPWMREKFRPKNGAHLLGKYDIVERLMSHKEPMVGGVYAARSVNGALVCQPYMQPRSTQDTILANQIRSGGNETLVAVNWLAAGCMLVHRTVFEKIKAADPGAQAANDPIYPFFSPDRTIGLNVGEDVAFSLKAKAAGFSPMLDCAIVCAHVGRKAFLPEDTAQR
jgi:hypothetical protein